MRVYVAPCGIGLGHITRTSPIADELNHRGHETVFSTYLDGLDYAKRNHISSYEAVPISFRVKSDGTMDFKMTAATSGFSLGIRRFLRQVVREIKYMKTFRPDVVFSDSRASSLLAARMLRIPVVLMLNQFRVEIIRRPSARRLSLLDRLFFFIANIGWLFIRTAIEIVWGRSQIILIPDLPHPNTICLGNLAIPRRYNGKVRLIGPIVDCHSQSIDDPGRIKRRLGFDSRKPLIYAAVSGPKVEREVLAKILLDSVRRIPERYSVVLSCGNPSRGGRPRSIHGMRVYDWIENQDDFIEASDLVISRAGHGTIMKSIAHGRPMILIPIPDHTEQYGNARRATSLHVAEMIDQNRVNEQTLEMAIRQILGNGMYRMKAVKIGERAASMHAVSLACNLISSTASHN
jgi:UDP-N-acetylglucosamine--N-acetylmuramyl-(pentapeptide) pyrophosphoryl-undecaprenol N-acetylglucosamine transferase